MNAKYINLFAAICILAIGVTILQTGRLIGQLSIPPELDVSVDNLSNLALAGGISNLALDVITHLALVISALEQTHETFVEIGNNVEKCGYVMLLLDAIYLIAILIAIFRRKPPPPLAVLAALFIPLGLLLGNLPTANAQTELTPKCETPTLEDDPSCWLKVEEHDNCYIWIDDVEEEHTVTWSGQCQAGKAQGRGKDTREYVVGADTRTRNGIGSYLNGKRDGRWKIRWSDDEYVGAEIGLYVDGKRHGQWEIRWPDGDVETGPYVDGKRHGQWEKQWSRGHVETGPYVDGKRQGQWERRRTDGAVDTLPYVDDKLHGQMETRLADGGVSTAHYVDGKLHGQAESREADGSRTCAEFFNGRYVTGYQKC